MKLQAPFIQLPIRFDADALAREVLALDPGCWRDRAVGATGNSALTLVTAGGDPDNDDLSGPMRPTPWLERCPYVMQVMQALGATWGRSRLMRLSGGSQVSAHVDTSYYWRDRMRVHVPIVTVPAVRFQCGEAEVHMAQGECWIFDTWRRHRVVNESTSERIHLVCDTVGGERFWELVESGRPFGAPARPGWAPRLVAPADGAPVALDFESVNAPVVMSPWELRATIGLLLGDVVPGPRLPAIHHALARLSRHWHALWAAHGEATAGWPRYRALLDVSRRELLAAGADQVGLRNEIGLMQALDSYVFSMALADQDGAAAQDVHGAASASAPVPASPAAAGREQPAVTRRTPASAFDRPVFIVSPPRSGSTLLFETLAGAPGIHTIGDESHGLIEGVPGLAPAERGYASNRLLAEDADPDTAESLRARFMAALRDRAGRPPADIPVRMLEKTPKNALRIPFLARVFPDARFIYLHRDPRQVLASMIEGWRSGRFRTYPDLPGWSGPDWSFLLVPGWRELAGRPLAGIVGAQWERTTSTLLDDLGALPRERWTAVDYDRLLSDPQGEVVRVADWMEVDWDRELGSVLPLSRYTLTAPDAEKWRRHEAEVLGELSGRASLVARAWEVALHGEALGGMPAG